MGRLGLDWALLCDAHRLDPSRLSVLDEFQAAPEDRRRQVLAEMSARAVTGDPLAVRVFAAALSLAGDHEQAALVLRGLVADRPAEPVARVDLAGVELALGNVRQCHDHLLAAAEHAEPDLREVVRARLAELSRWTEWRNELVTFHDLRRRALRERFAITLGTVKEHVALAVSLMALARLNPTGTELAEAIEVLHGVRARDPVHVRTLELLLTAKVAAGDVDDVDDIVRDLERVAPHSPLLPAMGQYFAEATQRPPAMVAEHMQRALEGDANSLVWLRDAYRHDPHNRLVINALMCAESIRGSFDEAVRLADVLTRFELDHAVHFNVAQVYARAGRRPEADRHFGLAHLYARDDQDRADVAYARRLCESRP